VRIVFAIRMMVQLVKYFLVRTRWGRVLGFLSLPLLLLLLVLWQPVHEPPIFDAQVHYNEEAWSRVSPEAIMNGVEDINIPWMLVGSTPNEGTWKLYARNPARVIPMLVPGDSREHRETWPGDPAMPAYIEAELARRPYRGLGELFLFDVDAKTPVARQVLALAANRRLVFHTRSDPPAIRHIFTAQPSLRVLWAHAGVDVSPERVSQLLDYYPNLWVELSHRRSVAPQGELNPEWKALMLRHPDRVLLGSGTYTSHYWYKVRTYMSDYRDWLKELPEDVAENIAWRNGAMLFDLPVPNTSSPRRH